MLDKSIPYYPISMIKTDTRNYPCFSLPEGYSFTLYQEGDEKEWSRLECELGQFENTDEGIEVFKKEFLVGHNLDAKERVLFVRDNNGEIVATAALWNGIYLGVERDRVHWIAVSDKCAGKGIAKAMLSKIIDMYNELNKEGYLYLWTGTWNYPAIAIYRKFGFSEYKGRINPLTNKEEEGFLEENENAISLASEKINNYRK